MTFIKKAMLLAAGLGTRMGPLSAECPKPLIKVLGKPLIDYGLDHCIEYGVRQIIVNTHYLPNQICSHVSKFKRVTTIYEKERLETGGGVKNALSRFGQSPFFVINSDALWVDGPYPALKRLALAWDENRMDALLLLYPVVRLTSYMGHGDYHVDGTGIAQRRAELEVSPYIFAGVQILHPRLFQNTPAGAFSLNTLYDQAESEGRLYAQVHDGDWYHVGTPEELRLTEIDISQRNIAVNNR